MARIVGGVHRARSRRRRGRRGLEQRAQVLAHVRVGAEPHGGRGCWAKASSTVWITFDEVQVIVGTIACAWRLGDAGWC
jgi:hypothetical protein